MKAVAALALTLALALGGIFVFFSFNSCDIEDPPSTPIYHLAVAQSANSAHVSTRDTLAELASTINTTGGQLGITLIAGKPEVLCSGVEIPVLEDLSQTRLQGRLDHESGPLAPLFQIDTAQAASPELDYVESLRLAASHLNSAANQNTERTRYLHIFGPGIDTQNEKLSYARGILSRDYKAVIEEMASYGVLPNLAGVNVVWFGLAQGVAEPQMNVPYEYVPKMKELWGYFLEQCGAQSVVFQDVIVSQQANTTANGYASVTPVPFAPTESSSWLFTEYLSLTENVLGFNPEEATYRDTQGLSGNEVAQGVLAPYAEALKHSGQTLVICGSAWNDGSGDEMPLSRLRAERVRDDLVTLGVPASQLIVVGSGNLGVGLRVGERVVDFYLPEQPEESRAIHFIPTDGGLADDVLARFSAS